MASSGEAKWGLPLTIVVVMVEPVAPELVEVEPEDEDEADDEVVVPSGTVPSLVPTAVPGLLLPHAAATRRTNPTTSVRLFARHAAVDLGVDRDVDNDRCGPDGIGAA
jgi:hypothetical protein